MSTPSPLIDYARFLNTTAAHRSLSAIRKIWSIQNQAGPRMISFGTGTPNPACFPFESITARTRDGRTIDLSGEELDVALGYTASPGFPPLVDWLMEFQRRVHDPPYARANPNANQVITLPGSEDGQCKVLEMILEPGDPVLITEPTYPGMLSALRPLRPKVIVVEMDAQGIRPESLESIMKQFSTSDRSADGLKSRRPKIFLTQPNHVNPTGVSTTLERRKAIYRLACDYDLLLIEDDPYYFLTFQNDYRPPPSFLSLDTEGRVLRLDSFSKVVSGGLRVGVLSGPRALVERVVMHIGCSSQQASTLSQALLLRLLIDWGHEGYLNHCRSVAEFYADRCGKMLTAVERHLTGVAEWSRPTGGMFLWIEVLGLKDTKRMIDEKAVEKMVMLAPGNYFMWNESEPSSFLRASYSWASEKEMNEGFRRLKEMIEEEKKTQG